MSDWIETGETAPDFELLTDRGARLRLRDLRGRPVVLYFYPKDDTPGCTREACAFRDRSVEIEALRAHLIGISPDSVESHAAFRDAHDLSFPLLADDDHLVAERYGAWREKNLYGKRSWGIQRSTFLIDAEGRVSKVWRRVRVDGHDRQVLDELRRLRGEPVVPGMPSGGVRSGASS